MLSLWPTLKLQHGRSCMHCLCPSVPCVSCMAVRLTSGCLLGHWHLTLTATSCSIPVCTTSLYPVLMHAISAITLPGWDSTVSLLYELAQSVSAVVLCSLPWQPQGTQAPPLRIRVKQLCSVSNMHSSQAEVCFCIQICYDRQPGSAQGSHHRMACHAKGENVWKPILVQDNC